ncbi:unnamed protein product [Allacma fusca]|uniref:RRM domain-containing protein n=1 Tax=Allacma fusca TaxID=39272 RepID=A0A8J2LCZ1_9HEXA|nr:unnamed protein product [Allacma fusca]
MGSSFLFCVTSLPSLFLLLRLALDSIHFNLKDHLFREYCFLVIFLERFLRCGKQLCGSSLAMSEYSEMNSSSLELQEDKMMESSSADDSSIISKSDLVDSGRRATSTPIDKWSTSCPSISIGNGDSSDIGVDHSESEYGSKQEMYGVNAPKYGTLVPNRIFVGGISSSTTEEELVDLFSPYGSVRATKIIVDRAGVSKGYGFVTFETEEEAKRLYNAINDKEIEPIIHRERRLNIAPAVKKQTSIVSDGIPVSRAHEMPYGSALEGTTSAGFGLPYYTTGHGNSTTGQYYQQQSYEPYFHQSTGYGGPQPSLQPVYSAGPPGQVCYIQTPYPGYQQMPSGTAYISVPASSSGHTTGQPMYTTSGGTNVPTAYVVDPVQNGPWTALTPGAPTVPVHIPISSWTNVPMYREIDGTGLGSLLPQGSQPQQQHDPDLCNCLHQMNAMQINSY